MHQHPTIDETHDPAKTSWVPGSDRDSSFPIQSLPYCTFIEGGIARAGVGIGHAVVDLLHASKAGLFDSHVSDALDETAGRLDRIMEWPRETVRSARQQLSRMLSTGADLTPAARDCLIDQSTIRLDLPVKPYNFTDFFTSVHHAKNAGELRRPGQPLTPNFHHLPIAYNGRASSVRVSGFSAIRPIGQISQNPTAPPVLKPSSMLDFECEIAIWLGGRTELGHRLSMKQAPSHIFGVGLLNDWSARDIQLWESQPLGPHLSKSFLTTVSPWVITSDALEPFRIPAALREPTAPPLLPYLEDKHDQTYGGLSINLTVAIQSEQMRLRGIKPYTISSPSFKDQYWTISQMLAHLTSNGCNISAGDLVGSGTVSGPSQSELGCLLEFTKLGHDRFTLPSGETRLWLEDFDEVIISGSCNAPGYVPIDLGEARGRVAPPLAEPFLTERGCFRFS